VGREVRAEPLLGVRVPPNDRERASQQPGRVFVAPVGSRWVRASPVEKRESVIRSWPPDSALVDGLFVELLVSEVDTFGTQAPRAWARATS